MYVCPNTVTAVCSFNAVAPFVFTDTVDTVGIGNVVGGGGTDAVAGKKIVDMLFVEPKIIVLPPMLQFSLILAPPTTINEPSPIEFEVMFGRTSICPDKIIFHPT